MIDAAQLTASSVTAGKPPEWIAYTMIESAPWGLGYLAFVETRWGEVAASLGIPFEGMPRSLFRPQFIEQCARRVRMHYGMPA